MDSLQQYFYIVGIPLSFLGSVGAVAYGHIRSRRQGDDQQQIYQLLVLADEARTAEGAELDRIETGFNQAVIAYVNQMTSEKTSSSADILPRH